MSRYVAAWKLKLRQGYGSQELIWHSAECQVDFGECDMYVRGNTAVSLATKLDEARRGGTLEKLFQSIDLAELVILDEWGSLPLEKE